MEHQPKTLEQAITDVVKAAISQAIPERSASVELSEKGKRIRGIRELATYLQCSTATAQALKNRNAIEYYQVGNRLFFYSGEVDAALKHEGR